MNWCFEQNLAQVLGHTLVWLQQEEERAVGVPAGTFRNDFSPSTPPPRDAAQEGRDMLAAQIELSPAQLQAQQQTRPAYDALNLQSLERVLYGTEGTPGVASLYRTLVPQVEGMQRDANTAQREQDIADVRRLGPDVQAAFRAANPQQAALLDELNNQTLSELQAGTSLDPTLRNDIENNLRAGSAARGFGFGQPDAVAEAFTLGEAGQRMRAARQTSARAMAGVNQAASADPFAVLLGRSSAPAAAGGVFSAGQGQSGTSGSTAAAAFDPFSGYGADVANTNFNANAAARIAGANNDAAAYGGLMSSC
jgi:hypothetical protein